MILLAYVMDFRSKPGPRYGEFGCASLDGLGSPTRRRDVAFPVPAGKRAGDPRESRPCRKKAGPALADPGKYAGGKPATGRLCRIGPAFKGEGPELARMTHLCDMALNAPSRE